MSVRAAELVVLSGKSAEALAHVATRLRADLEDHPEHTVGDVAFTLATTGTHDAHRVAFAASSRNVMGRLLEAVARGETPAGVSRGLATGSAPKVVFVFSGQGSQWLGMGRELLAEEPAFRVAIEACDKAIAREAGWSLLEELGASSESSGLGRIDVVQPALFAMGVALAALWRSWGVEPDVVVGHSMGEVAAACVAGSLSLADGAAVICRRSRLLRRISGQGEMAMVALSVDEAEEAIAGVSDRVSIAVSNGRRATVLSGEPAAIATVLSALEARRVFCRRVKVDVASHSPQVDELREELLEALARVEPRAASVAMRSTVTGAMVEGSELTASYWVDNVRQPVRFAYVVEQLLSDGYGLFLEMSPHAVVLPAVEELRRETGAVGAAVRSLRRQEPERASMLESVGALYVAGHPLDFERLFPEGRRVELATNP